MKPKIESGCLVFCCNGCILTEGGRTKAKFYYLLISLKIFTIGLQCSTAVIRYFKSAPYKVQKRILKPGNL